MELLVFAFQLFKYTMASKALASDAYAYLNKKIFQKNIGHHFVVLS
jgi:hypothetical protein